MWRDNQVAERKAFSAMLSAGGFMAMSPRIYREIRECTYAVVQPFVTLLGTLAAFRMEGRR